MKVLIISHNCFSKIGNMGKTLLSYFSDFQPEEIAQFYIHSEVPTDDSLCWNYYRFTDQDAIRSLTGLKKYGRSFRREDIQTQRTISRTDSGVVGSVYQMGRKRTAGIYALRNLLWKLSRWNTREFRNWLDDFSPDVIFYASGDYSFSYDIALTVAEYTGKPLVVLCVDDFYLHNRNENSLLGKLTHAAFLKKVRRTMDRASRILVISESMKQEYDRLFGKPCRVLHTSAERKEVPVREQRQLSYMGNLGLNRYLQLIRMGRALMELNLENGPRMIDVYSGERNPEILKELTEENGIRFHGMVSQEEILEIMGRSMAVIHTEDFAPETTNIVRFSVSTKIAETLMYGPCLVAVGPEEIASMAYLKENGAAYTICDPRGLSAGLKEVLTDEKLRQQIVERARVLANKNHSADTNSHNVRRWLEEAMEN